MRVLAAITAGLLVGVVLLEALTAGLLMLVPETALLAEYGEYGLLSWPLLPLPALLWLMAGLAGGTMSAAVAQRPLTGVVTGALLALPAGLIVGLARPGSLQMVLAMALPFCGALAGALLVARVLRADTAASAPGQAV